MEINFAKVGKRIQLIRKGRGISQEQLADIIGVSKGHVSHVETGSKNPSAEMLINIADALGVSVDSLLSDLDLTRQEDSSSNELLIDCTPVQQDILTRLTVFMKTLLQEYDI